MEIIILVLAAGVAVWWFFLREKKDQSQPVAPYKVDLYVDEPSAPYKVEVPAPPAVTSAPEAVVAPATKDNRDLNKDGVVSAEEKAVWVEKLDLNKDGVVDASEKKVAKTRAKQTKLLRPAVEAKPPAKPRVKKAT
jgi:hypothetical protein